MYGFGLKSPYLQARNASQQDESDNDSDSSSKAGFGVMAEEELLGECHVGFEKLLSSLF